MKKVFYCSNNSLLVYNNGRVIKKNLQKERGVITASLDYKDIYNLNFKLPIVLDEDMLNMEIEKYIYEKSGLDFSKEYKIVFYKIRLEHEYYIEAFIAEADVLKSLFSEYLDKFKYIDFIVAKPVVFKSFYEISNQTPKTDFFIYLNENDAFVSCFRDGEFLFVKNVIKLSVLAKNLSVSFDELKKILMQKGLDASMYEDEFVYDEIDRFFSDIFSKITSLINYSVSYYSIEKVDRIYFYSPFNVKQIIEHYKEYWDLMGVEFLKYSINTDYDDFDYTALMYNVKHYKNEYENFSVFEKPPAFYKRNSGKFFLFVLSVILAGGVDASYKFTVLHQQQREMVNLKKKIQKKINKIFYMKKEIKKLMIKNSALSSENIKLQNLINSKRKLIESLKKIYFQKPLCDEISDIINLLKKYNLKVITFSKNGTHTDLIIVVKEKERANIAKFLESLIKLNYKNVFASEISDKNQVYISKVSYDE